MLKRLNRTWRRAATGLCFAVFGIGGLLLSISVLPLQRLLIRQPQQRQLAARLMVQRSFRAFIGMMRWVGVFNFDFPAQQQLKAMRGCVVIANHPCLIDVVALIAILPKPTCVVKSHLWRNPFMRGVIQSTGYISNAEPDGLIADCQRAIAAGDNLIIFPEGTRTGVDGQLHFQRGAAHLALRTEAPIAALWIDCQPVTLTKGEAWYQSPKQKPTLSIRYLRQIDTEPFRALTPSIAARRLTEQLNQFYNKVAIYGFTEPAN